MGIPVEEAARGTEAAPQAIAPAVDPGSVSMTPQVLVVNGQIVINEKSLTVNAAVERATALSDFTRVEESGTKLNSATYANYTKAEKWTREDTEFFFQALRQFGTDFSLIQRLFPNRSRRQIKKKYLVEDKLNPDRVEEAIKNLNPDTALYQNLIDVLKTPDSHVEPEGGLARAVLDKLPAPEEVDVADRQEMKMRTTRGRGKR
jgi:transcription factor TFIIIB component B''